MMCLFAREFIFSTTKVQRKNNMKKQKRIFNIFLTYVKVENFLSFFIVILNLFRTFALSNNNKRMIMKKFYQVNEKHFFISNGIEYLSAVSPFTKNCGFKSKEMAISVAKSILDEHKNLADTLEVCDLEKLETSNNLVGTITKKYGLVYRIVVVVEEIEILG